MNTRKSFADLLPGDTVVGKTGTLMARAIVRDHGVVRVAWYGRSMVSEHVASDRVLVRRRGL